MSRTAARKQLSVDTLREAMTGQAWNAESAQALLDEHPSSYKDIDRVMADQTDLVAVQHTLAQVFNYKGV
jgi:tRNA-splicing ligase RtcB